MNCFASVQSSSGEGGSPGPGSGWLLHGWWGNEKSWSQRNENMCIGRLPLLNVPHDPGGQMAFYVVFTTVILDWLLNLFVFLTQLPASRLAFSLTQILRAGFEQLHYNFFFSLLLLPWCQPLLPDPDLFACPESNMVNKILFPTGLIKWMACTLHLCSIPDWFFLVWITRLMCYERKMHDPMLTFPHPVGFHHQMMFS